MTIIFPLLLSTVIGLLIVDILLEHVPPINKTLTVIIAAGIGIGISANLTFYSFFLFNGYNPLGIAGFNIVLIVLLLILRGAKIIAKLKKLSMKFNPLSPIAWILWGIILYALIFMAKMHPYGEWDAWALYNMKMKFLIYSGDNWNAIFNQLHWYTQPDYPLMLPLINVYNYALSGLAQPKVPLITGVLFAMLTAWLVFGGLKQIMHTNIAFMASFLLLANPFYIFQSTAQYADTILAFYLLATLICLQLTLLHNKASLALLTGLTMGFMTFSKNEGIVISILLIALFSLYLVCRRIPVAEKKQHLILIPILLGGFMITSSSTILLKLFLAPANKDIFSGLSIIHMKFFNWNGFTMILDAFVYEFTHKRWAFMWIFILGLLLVANKKIFSKECKVFAMFMIVYLGILVFIYLTTVNFDLSWRLKSTVHRICFYLLPSILFFCYYTIFKKIKT